MRNHGRQQAGHLVTDEALEHAGVQELVAAFADGELSGEEGRAVEEHLRGCERCRRELTIQQDLSSALAREPTPGTSAGLRQRIEGMGEPQPARSDRGSAFRLRWASPALAALVLLGIAGGAALLAGRARASRQMAAVPLLHDALADCRRAMSRNFPKKADLPAVTENLTFPVRALEQPGLELFSTWKTTLAGSPAVGLAYRWRGVVVVQYAVPADLVRQQPRLAETVSGAAVYEGSLLGQGVIALLQGGSGTLLIAEVAPGELRKLIL
jgi:putative zinc finger protein